jgi:UDP-N-acetylglucosamine--N-acetylmuramyl-(pentapeptide) pyrophosphoryl-undecaprenol N-acetylglucosamine transferase
VEGPILLSAGGTGGHLFPAEALAHELRQRGRTVHLATDSRAERYAGDFPADAVHIVRSATIGSRNPVAVAKAVLTLFGGIREAGRLIARIKPSIVVGFGGYPTLPPVYAATRARVPSMIHEQNAVMGRANRLLAARVDAIAGGFLPDSGGDHGAKTVTTGNPVRPAVLDAANMPYHGSASDAPFHLVVFGGSQGARYFSEVLPAAIEHLNAEQRVRLRVTQQARAEDAAELRERFTALGIAADISPFFTDMAARIGAAHLVISRSGASTVSEISAIGRPAILVPYPHALDHDQAANAAALKARGGAEVIAQSALDAPKLANLLASAMNEPERLADTAERAKAAGRPEATHLLADMVEAIAARTAISTFKEQRS